MQGGPPFSVSHPHGPRLDHNGSTTLGKFLGTRAQAGSLQSLIQNLGVQVQFWKEEAEEQEEEEMPYYTYECTGCGFRFDQRQKMADPNPTCRGEVSDYPQANWLPFLQRAREAFARGEKVAHPVTGEMVGPEWHENVMRDITQPDIRTLKEWVHSLRVCGKPTQRIPSLSSFHLKGSGWAADGY